MVLKDHKNRFGPDDQDNVAGSVDGRILGKLKFPKNIIINDEKIAEDEVLNKSTNTNYDHYCVDCKRSFTSGKALGGHISSAHVQAKKDNHKLKSSNKRKFNQGSGSGSGSGLGWDYICKICSKGFSSPKSLFGYMRSHPERNWRGVEPPEKESAEEYSLNDALMTYDEEGDNGDSDMDPDPAEDMSMCLKAGWSVKDKRGRGSLKPNFESFLEEEEQVCAVGHELLRLVNASENRRSYNESSKLEKEKINSDDGSYGRHLHLNEIDNNNVKDKILFPKFEEMEGNEPKFKNIESVKGKRVLKGRPNKKLKSSMDSFSPKTPGEFSCTICKKKFTTHQALGGHMSSHGKITKVSIHNTSEYERANKLGSSERDGRRKIIVDDGNVLHICKVCDKVFPTGQALGSHKKCHRMM